MKKTSVIFLFFPIYIILLIIFWEVINVGIYRISLFLLFGFAIVFITFLVFINVNHDEKSLTLYEQKWFSEDLIKFIILILMSITFFIPPITEFSTIILWEEIGFLNYFRATIFLIGCAYLPGANLYNLIFHKSNLHERFKVEPFFLKLTLYPLISFSFLGICVLILDQIGLNRIQINYTLFILIFILFFSEFFIDKTRNDSQESNGKKISISKSTLIILILAIGIATISIGFQLSWSYIISGDPWDSIKFAKYVGDPEINPIFIYTYPNFWGYISFSLSALSGLPLININSLLAPFSYLFITSIYLFIKSILVNFKSKYSVLSTLLISIFSGFLINPLVSSLIFAGEYYFIYKSYSFILFFTGLALFFILSNNQLKNNSKKILLVKSPDFKFITLGAIFLALSFMTYMFPLFTGIIFLLLFCLISRKIKNLDYLITYVLILTFFMFIFDIILSFYLSNNIRYFFLVFFNFNIIAPIIKAIPVQIFTILLFSGILLFLFLLRSLINNISKKDRPYSFKFRLNTNLIFKIGLLFLSIFLSFEIFLIILKIIPYDYNLNGIFFFFYLDKIFLNIGIIGIIGLLLSKYSFNKENRIYLLLISWILFSLIFASLLIYKEWISNFGILPEDITEDTPMIIWFDRIWIYSIPAFCILTSVGIYEFTKKYKNHDFLNKKKCIKPFLKHLTFLSILSLCFSGIIITGINKGNAKLRYNETRIEAISWISDNIPMNSGVLVIDNFFMGVGIDSITIVRQHFFDDFFFEEFNTTLYAQKISQLKTWNIPYIEISQSYLLNFPNISNFINDILIPNFYNETIFENEDIIVCYAPYFN